MVSYTFNVSSINNESGEERYHKVKIHGPERVLRQLEDDAMPIYETYKKWLGENYPNEHIDVDNFIVVCEGEYESAEGEIHMY